MQPCGVFATKYESDIAVVRTKTQWFLLCALLLFLCTLPAFASRYWLGWMTGLFVTILAVLGLHILTGLCGIVSLGQAAFVAVGAYTTAVLDGRYGLSGWLCLPVAGVSAGLAGLLFGLPSFRLKGFYIAIATIAANFVILWCARYFQDWTGGSTGTAVAPLQLGGIAFTSRASCYFLGIALVVFGTFFAKNVQRTATGRAFVAIRDNELAAEVSGVNLFRYKMTAFFIGCMYAGVAGWLLAYSQLWVTPDQFQLYNSIWYFGMLAIGGLGSTTGVFLGVMFLAMFQMAIDRVTPLLEIEHINVALNQVFYALVIVAFLLFEPNGLYSRWVKLKTYYRLRPFSYRGG